MRTEIRIIDGKPVKVTICPPAPKPYSGPTVRARGGRAKGGRRWEDHEGRFKAIGRSWKD